MADNVRVNLSELTPKFLAAAQNERVSDLAIDAAIQGKTHIFIPTKEYEEMKERVFRVERKWEIHQGFMEARAKAVALEKSGDIDEASEIYKQTLHIALTDPNAPSINAFAYDIERLLVIYRKLKQKDKELELLNMSIEKFPKYNGTDGWKKRLSKLGV